MQFKPMDDMSRYRVSMASKKGANEKGHFLLQTFRRLFRKGLLPLTLYKVFLRLSPNRWLPNASFARLTLVIDGQEKAIVVDLNDAIGKEAYLYGWYDKMVLDFARNVVKGLKSNQPLAYVDVGANIGNHSLYLGDLFDVVVSFEPNPVAYDRLKANIADSGFDFIEAIPVGLSDRKDRRPFAIPNKYNLGSARIVAYEKAQFMIDVERGDVLLEGRIEGDLAFIKIDVEGHEPNVVRGLEQVIKTHRPVIMFEYSSDTIRNDRLFISDCLVALDYSFFGTTPATPWVQLLTLSNHMRLYDFNFEHRCETVFSVPKKRLPQFMRVAESLGML